MEIPKANISSVQFGTFKPDDIKKQAVVHISEQNTQRSGIVQKHGVHDSFLGPSQPDMLCGTCACDQEHCPGHIGYIELAQPVFNCEFLDYVLRLLQIVCVHCCRLLLPDDHPRIDILKANMTLKGKLSKIAKLCERRIYCESQAKTEARRTNKVHQDSDEYCGGKQPRFYKVDNITIEGIAEDRTVLTPKDIWNVLRFIDRTILRQLGFDPENAHPEGMMWVNFVVPRINIRPSTSSTQYGRNRKRGEDDLSLRLVDIIKANRIFRDKLANQTLNILKTNDTDENSELYELYLNLARQVACYQNGKLKAKGNTYGRDRKSLRDRFGTGKYGMLRGSCLGKRMNYAARSVITPDPYMHLNEVGVPKDVCMRLTFPERVTRFNMARLTRCVRNGPNIHPGANFLEDKDGGKSTQVDLGFVDRNSIVLRLGQIVRRHLVNGDWVLMNRNPSLHKMSMMAHQVRVTDGYSFRMHLAVTPGYNADFDGDEMNLICLQDHVARAEAKELMLAGKNVLKDGKPIIQFVQHSIISLWLLGKEIHIPYERVCQMWMQYTHPGSGTLLYPEEKPYTGFEFLSLLFPEELFVNLKNLCIENGVVKSGVFNKRTVNGRGGLIHIMSVDFGFTFTSNFISSMYLVLDEYIRLKGFSVTLEDCFCDIPQSITDKVNETIAEAESLGNLPYSDDTENRICSLVDAARDIKGNYVVQHFRNNTHRRNGLNEMVNSGAKGTSVNIVQICAMLGQQRNHESERFRYHTRHKVNILESHGFVSRGFGNGVSALNYFSHAGGARVGLVSTSVNTKGTGYMHRRLVKCIEDVTTDIFGCVRNAQGSVLQTVYANDGFHGTYVEMVPLRVFEYGIEWYGYWIAPELEQAIAKAKRIAPAVTLDPHTWTTVGCPVQFSRLFRRIRKRLRRGDRIPAHEILARTQALWYNMIDQHTLLGPSLKVTLLYFDWMSVREIQQQELDYTGRFDDFLTEVEFLFGKGRIPSGEPVGLIAAQNCGEPLTQMTLNVFHNSGLSSKLVDGVPRVEEIINLSKRQRTPSMKIFLRSKANVEDFALSLVELKLSDLTVNTLVEELSVRVQLNKETCILHQITPYHLCEALRPSFESIEFNPGSIFEVPWTITIKVSCGGPFWEQAEQYAIDAKTALHKQLGATDIKVSQAAIMDVILDIVTQRMFQGISGITDFANTFQDVGLLRRGKLVNQRKPCIITQGSSLAAVLSHPMVDTRYTISNDINEVTQVLGVDAACALIEWELMSVYNKSGAAVLRRHLKIIAQRMTRSGRVLPTTHAGVAHDEGSVIRSASFESPMESFITGCIEGKLDPCQGITECIIVNKRPRLGTGNTDMHLLEGKNPVPIRIPYEEQPIALLEPNKLQRYFKTKRPLESHIIQAEIPMVAPEPKSKRLKVAVPTVVLFAPPGDKFKPWDKFQDEESCSAFGHKFHAWTP